MIPSNSNIVSIIDSCKTEPGKMLDIVKETVQVVNELIKLFSRTTNQKLKIAGKGIGIFKVIINDLAAIFDTSNESTPMSILSDPDVVKGVENMKIISSNLLTITKTIIKLSLQFVLFLVLYPIFKIGMVVLENAFKTITNFVNKAAQLSEESVKNIEKITTITKSLVSAVKSIIVLALLTLPLLMAVPLAIMGVIGIILFVVIVAKLISFVKILSTDAPHNIHRIALIILSLMAIALMIVVFGLITPILIKYAFKGMLSVIVLLLFVTIVSVLLSFIGRMISSMITQIVMFIVLMTIIMGALLFAAGALLLISFMGEAVQKKLGSTLLIIGVAVLVGAAIAGLGYLTLFIAPGVLGIMAFTVALLCVLVMVAVLRIIQEIELDREAILKSVNTIFDTASQVIGRIFQSRKDPEETDRSGDAKMSAISHGPMSNIWTVVKLLIGCATLFLTLIAVVIILIIASILRILQELDLNEDLIMKNVNTVMNTCQHIIQSIFYSQDAKTKKTDKGFLFNLLTWIGGPVVTIVEAVLAVAYVASMMLAIGMILLIALMLKGLQNMDLKPSLIIRNVDIIISTCQHIIEAILYPKEANTKKTNKGFLFNLLTWIGGPIATIIEAVLAVAYVASMMLAIGMILLMAHMLKDLQEIKLKPDKILENVNIVISTCQEVQYSVFNPDESKTKKSSQNFLWKLLKWIGGPIFDLVEVILSVAYLASAMMAIGLIQLLARQLRDLQKIDLNAEKVLENVKIVISTCQEVQYSIFNPDESETKKSSKRFIMKILKWIGGPIVDIIEVIMACAYLATAMMAIGLIQVLARQLEDLQNIPLDANAVTSNVDTVINTCQHIVQKVLYPNEDKTNSSSKGFIRKLLKWIGGPIVDIIDVIMACAYLATSMMAVGLVSSLAQQLQIIADIDFDANKIKTNVDTILDCAGHVVKGINRSASEFGTTSSRKGWLARMIRKIAPDLFSIIDSLAATAQVAVASASIAIVLKIGKLLTMIGKFEIDTKKIKDNVTNIFDCIEHVKALVDEKCAPREELVEGNWYDRWQAARKQARSDRDQMQQLNKVNAIVMKLATMANSLGDIQKITINESLLKSRIEFLFSTIDRIQDYMNKKAEMKAAEMDKYIRKRRGWFGITWYEYTEEYYKKIRSEAQAMGDLDRASVIMVKLGEMATNLEKIQKIEINESAVIKNIGFLFSTMDNISNYFYEREQAISRKAAEAMMNAYKNNKSMFGAMFDVYDQHSISEGAINTIDSTSAVYVALGSMAENLTKINDLKVDPGKVAQNTIKILDCVDFITSKLAEREEKQVSIEESICLQHVVSINEELDKLKQFDDKAITNTKKTLDNYTKFLDKVNAINPDKVRITTEMFGQMARFSESINGNFDDLADSINDKLMPLLKELKEVMDQANKSLETGFNSTNETLMATSPVQVSESNMNNVVKASNPGMSPEQQQAEATRKMAAQMKNQNNTLASKLDEMIQLLSGSGRIRTITEY